MSDDKSLWESVLLEFVRILQPVVDAAHEQPAGSGFLRIAREVGYDLEQVADFPRLVDVASKIVDAYADITAIVEDPRGFSAEIFELIDRIAGLLNALSDLDGLLPPGTELKRRLLDYLIVSYAEQRYPLFRDLLVLAGIFACESVPAQGDELAYERRDIHWDRIGELLGSPGESFRKLYGWGEKGADLNSNLLLARLGDVLWSLGLPLSYIGSPTRGTDGILSLKLMLDRGFDVGLRVEHLPGTETQLPGLSILPTIAEDSADFRQTLPLGQDWQLEITVRLGAKSGYGLFLRPGGVVRLGALPQSPAVDWDFEGGILLSRQAAGQSRFILLGVPDETRLEAESLGLAALVKANADGGEFGFEASLTGGQLVIQSKQGDSFIQRLLPSDAMTLSFEAALGWSSNKGFYIKGSSSLETTIPVRRSLGPVRIDSIYLKLAALDQDRFGLTAAASIAVKLGVVNISVDRIGLKTIISTGQSPKLSFKFQPPVALGVQIDGGAISGAGFLYFDQENNRYAGWLRLQVREFSLSAFGIVDLRPQPGVPYSFFIVIAATFPPVQLGWGFTLNGVGGLAGIHRTFDEQALQSAVRSDALDMVLFPKHPDADPLSIIDSVESLFPPAHGRYLFGPLVLIGWGTPTVLEAKLGFVLELPEPVRLAILGKIDATLPSDKVKILDLHLDLLGLIDFTKKTLAIDGHLHDSYIAGYSVGGDMAMRLAWGDPPYFALAIGGFHPQFPVPAGFPTTRRLTVSLISTEDVSLGLEAYLALTSNTAQFGAKAELNASKGGGSIHGTVYIDSLFTFSPFSMRADFGGSVDVRYHGKVIGSIDVQGHVTGPRPWHVWGKASISVWVADVDVPFSVTFGNPEPVSLPPAKTWEMLGPAIADSRNWSSPLPPWSTQVVAPTAAPSSNPSPALFDPAGTFTFRQKVLPFDYTLTRFGAAQPEDADRYEITSLRINKTTITDWSAASDFFAPAQFRQMSESEKLSSGSFETLHSGCRLPNLLDLGAGLGRKVECETKPESVVPDSAPLYTPTRVFQLAFLSRSAMAGAPLMNSGLRKYSPKGSSKPAATVAEETFVVTSSSDGTVRTDIVASSVTASAAQGALSSYLVKHPEEHGDLQIVPAHDVQEGVLEGPA